jgi:hypothetical protein
LRAATDSMQPAPFSTQPFCEVQRAFGGCSKKAKWTNPEDRTLVNSIENFGTANWSLVAATLPGRSGKQCRERWTSQFDPSLSRKNWTPDEDAVLVSQQRQVGNCWSRIAQFLPKRSANAVKNRWSWLTRHRPVAKKQPPKVQQEQPKIEVFAENDQEASEFADFVWD